MESFEFILFPDRTDRLALMGGKGAALSLVSKSFSVPPFFVISPFAFQSIKKGKGGPTKESFELKDRAKEELEQALPLLKASSYAVRSSAMDEDGAEHSFAGQLESFLNVSESMIGQRALDVVASSRSGTVKTYRSKHRLEGANLPCAVVVQKMLDPEMAGVVFSLDPVHPDRDEAIISATGGLADKLVSGELDGWTCSVSRERKGIFRQRKFQVHPGKGGEEREIHPTKKQIGQIVNLALSAEQFFGSPQDVEWAIEKGKLYLLQARPITSLAWGNSDSPAFPATSLSTLTIWDNSNIVESYSGVTSPLTFTFARNAYTRVYVDFSRLMGVTGKEIEENRLVFAGMLGYIHGHVYYNLLNWYRALALFPGFSLNRSFMEQMMGVSKALPDDLAKKIAPGRESLWGKLFEGIRFARTLFRLLGNGMILSFRVESFYRHLHRILKDPPVPLEKMGLQELGEYYRLLEKELLARWYTPIINDFLCMIAFGVTGKAMRKWCGDEQGPAILNDVLIGQGDIISAEPAHRIKEMARMVRDAGKNREKIQQRLERGDRAGLELLPGLQESFDSYLEKFGDRCTEELKLESLTLREDLASLLQAIGFTARREEIQSEGDQKTGKGKTSLCPSLRFHPYRRIVGGFLLRWTRRRIRDRENLRFQRTRVFGLVRRIVLEAGHRLVERGVLKNHRDVFYLEIEELMGVIEGTIVTYDLKALVALRKKQEKEFEKLGIPPNRFETYGAILISLLSEKIRFGQHRQRTSPPDQDGDIRSGIGCSAGVVEAKVRVIQDPRKETIRAGEILVARFTDPGWIALFSNAAGILVERGSLLSHSAIVSREMGIPAIVSIGGLMEWLETGDLVEMDGRTGQVRILERGRKR